MDDKDLNQEFDLDDIMKEFSDTEGETPAEELVSIPDFSGMTRQQAQACAETLGLYLLLEGNPETKDCVIVTAQDIPADTQVPAGTTVTLTFTDTKAKD